MPKPTFTNLTNEKKNRIMEACFDEFSRHTFSEASINQIIKEAGISRGSFYQYFESKEDCYLEVLGQIAIRKMELFKDIHAAHQTLNVFDQVIELIKQIAIWMEKEPRLYQIGVLMDLDQSDFIEKLRQQNPKVENYFATLIAEEQAHHRIRADIDPNTLSDVMVAMSQHVLQKHFKNHDFETMIQKAEIIYSILKRGTQGDDYV